MKIAFLSGAYENAGDFLIESRAMKLLCHFIQDISIDRFMRNELTGKCAQLNGYDAIVIGGGPVFKPEMESFLPVDEMVSAVKKPIMIVGGGWHGATGTYQQMYDYDFSNSSRSFLKKVDEEGFGLGCRDIYTYRILKKEGYRNVWLTGCPAWYNMDTLEQSTLCKNSLEVKSIVISDPAKPRNFEVALNVLLHLRERYPEAKITFLFHRGLSPDKYTPVSAAEAAMNLKRLVEPYCDDIRNISYSADGFSIYDNSDLHVGFRAHAHIYCLSMRNRSILIEEDGRGAGVNQILGLPSLKAYSDAIPTKIVRRLFLSPYRFSYHHLIEDLSTYLDVLSTVDKTYFENAFRLQQEYFGSMGKFISRINTGQGGT